METFNIHEAKTHLSKLVERGGKGRVIRHRQGGKAVSSRSCPLDEPVETAEASHRFPEGRLSRSQTIVKAFGREEIEDMFFGSKRLRLLPDTHLLVWLSDGSSALSSAAAELCCQDPGNDDRLQCRVACGRWRSNSPSAGLNSMSTRASFAVACSTTASSELAVTAQHALWRRYSLPPIHKDPFDRLLVAQATVEGLTLLTADATILRYPGPIRRV